MSEIVLVTGQMRSGTSLASSILHRLGWFAGVYITAPMPPSWRSDWEDPWAVDVMARKDLKPTFFKDWADKKRESAEIFSFSKIQLKSPYLALYLEDAKLALGNPFVVVTKRDPSQVRASMERHPQLDPRDQRKIQRALEAIQPNHVFDCDRCQEDPRTEIMSLCLALGFDPGSDLEDAIALVDQKKAQVF